MPSKYLFRVARGVGLGLLLVLGLLAQPLKAETQLDTNPLPKIFQDWEKRGREMAAVRYVLSGTTTWPRGSALPRGVAPSEVPVGYRSDNPDEDMIGDFSAVVTLDFQRSRNRLESNTPDYSAHQRQLYRVRTVHVGSESNMSCHILENSDSDRNQSEGVNFMIWKGDTAMMPASRLGELRYYPLFYASGVVSTPHHQVKASNMNPGLTPETFTFD